MFPFIMVNSVVVSILEKLFVFKDRKLLKGNFIPFSERQDEHPQRVDETHRPYGLALSKLSALLSEAFESLLRIGLLPDSLLS